MRQADEPVVNASPSRNRRRFTRQSDARLSRWGSKNLHVRPGDSRTPAGPQGFENGFLRGEPARIPFASAAFARVRIRAFCHSEAPFGESFRMTIEHRCDSSDLHQINAMCPGVHPAIVMNARRRV